MPELIAIGLGADIGANENGSYHMTTSDSSLLPRQRGINLSVITCGTEMLYLSASSNGYEKKKGHFLKYFVAEANFGNRIIKDQVRVGLVVVGGCLGRRMFGYCPSSAE